MRPWGDAVVSELNSDVKKRSRRKNMTVARRSATQPKSGVRRNGKIGAHTGAVGP